MGLGMRERCRSAADHPLHGARAQGSCSLLVAWVCVVVAASPGVTGAGEQQAMQEATAWSCRSPEELRGVDWSQHVFAWLEHCAPGEAAEPSLSYHGVRVGNPQVRANLQRLAEVLPGHRVHVVGGDWCRDTSGILALLEADGPAGTAHVATGPPIEAAAEASAHLVENGARAVDVVLIGASSPRQLRAAVQAGTDFSPTGIKVWHRDAQPATDGEHHRVLMHLSLPPGATMDLPAGEHTDASCP